MGCQGRRLESCGVIENLGGSPFEIMTEIISGGYEVPGPGAGGLSAPVREQSTDPQPMGPARDVVNGCTRNM